MKNIEGAEAFPRYRQILRRELPDHYFRPDNHHLLWMFVHMGIIAVSLWLMAAHFTWWAAPLLGLLIGHSIGCLGFVGHEICHGGAIRNRKLRHLLAGIAFSPYGIGPYLWDRWHNASHHGPTQHPDFDPDRLFMLDEYKNNPVLKWLYRMSPVARNTVIFSFFSMMMTQHNITMVVNYWKDHKSTNRDRSVMLFQFLLPKALWIGVTACLGWEVLLFGYAVPLLIGKALVISYIATNHFLNPLADENDVLAGSLSVTLPRWLKWLDVIHCRFGAHVAHHLFPQAPSRFARKIEEKIAVLWPDRFHVMPLSKALMLLGKTPWVYDTGGISLVDPETGSTSATLGRGLAIPAKRRKTRIRERAKR